MMDKTLEQFETVHSFSQLYSPIHTLSVYLEKSVVTLIKFETSRCMNKP